MFDLHMHTTFSDGKDSLEEIIDNVKNANIDFFSITDHDTAESARQILASNELQNKIKEKGLSYVTGCEFTCVYEGYEMHILAYDFDPYAPEIKHFENQMTALLKEKDVHRFKFLEDNGYVFSKQSKEYLDSRLNIRKLDLANCLVNDGYFPTLKSAIWDCLENIEYPRIYRLDGKEVVETLSKIGAKMVWAHSIHGLGEDPLTFEEIEQVCTKLKPYGLSGLECYYSLYNKEEISKLLEIAKKLDLFVTVGSDYHGANKKVALAEVSTDGTVPQKDEIKVEQIFKNIIAALL